MQTRKLLLLVAVFALPARAEPELRDEAALLDLAGEAYLLERPSESERYCREAIEASGGTSPDAFSCLSRSLIKQRRYDEAAEATEREVALQVESVARFKALRQLAAIRKLLGDDAGSTAALEEALEVAAEGELPQDQLAGPLSRLAYEAYREGRLEETGELVEEYLAAYEAAGFDRAMIPVHTPWLADFYLRAGQRAQAEVLYRNAMAYYQPPLSGDRKRVFLKWVDDYAAFLEADGRHSEASAIRLEGEKRASN